MSAASRLMPSPLTVLVQLGKDEKTQVHLQRATPLHGRNTPRKLTRLRSMYILSRYFIYIAGLSQFNGRQIIYKVVLNTNVACSPGQGSLQTQIQARLGDIPKQNCYAYLPDRSIDVINNVNYYALQQYVAQHSNNTDSRHNWTLSDRNPVFRFSLEAA